MDQSTKTNHIQQNKSHKKALFENSFHSNVFINLWYLKWEYNSNLWIYIELGKKKAL